MPAVRLALPLSIALLASCGDSGQITAPTSTPSPGFAAKPNPSFLPFAFTVANCVELVDVTGTFHPVVQSFVGPGGKELFKFHINAKGTGVGESTAARYQWNDRLFDITNIVPAKTVSFILNDNTRLIGQGGAANARFAVRIKMTINANGEVTVDKLAVHDTCG
jgi:hypothetical protein